MAPAKKIRVFDTTLRDGEQTPGVGLTKEKKLEIAFALQDLGLDAIEAGFPMNSESEAETVKQIGQELDIDVFGLARALPADIDACIDADLSHIHTFISTSPQHLKYQMNKTEDEVYEMAVKAVEKIVGQGIYCMFSPMDATRTELPYLLRVCKGVEEAGAKIINIPDTVGVMYPEKMKNFVSSIRKEIKIDLDTHCHNDFGLASANTLAAVEGGCDQVQVTINGLGERAGNADLEQVVMALKLLYGKETNIRTERIVPTSKLVERLTGIRVMPNFPIVGDNAFAHESGIHVHAVLKRAETFEPIKPEMVGAKRKLVLGKHIGVHGIDAKLKELGITVDTEQLKEITTKVKDLGGKGKKVVEEDLAAIAEDVAGMIPKTERKVDLLDMSISSNLNQKPVAKVSLKVNGSQKSASSEGVGPVDAVLKAIQNAIGEKDISLEEYRLDAITGGSDALAEVMITVRMGEETALARGVHEDVVMASVIAFINGLNRILK